MNLRKLISEKKGSRENTPSGSKTRQPPQGKSYHKESSLNYPSRSIRPHSPVALTRQESTQKHESACKNVRGSDVKRQRSRDGSMQNSVLGSRHGGGYSGLSPSKQKSYQSYGGGKGHSQSKGRSLQLSKAASQHSSKFNPRDHNNRLNQPKKYHHYHHTKVGYHRDEKQNSYRKQEPSPSLRQSKLNFQRSHPRIDDSERQRNSSQTKKDEKLEYAKNIASQSQHADEQMSARSDSQDQKVQRSSGKPTLKEQIACQKSESQKSLLEFMNSDMLKATISEPPKIPNNPQLTIINNNQKQNQNGQQQQLTPQEKVPDFYVKEQQQANKIPRKRLFSQQQQIQQSQTTISDEKTEQILGQWRVLQRFIMVSKVVLNKYQKILEQIRDKFLQSVTEVKDERLAAKFFLYFDNITSDKPENDKQLTERILEFAKETKAVFFEVFSTPDLSQKTNLIALKHALQRIFKACQIQLDDFLWKNGPYRESRFTSAAPDLEEDALDNDELILKTVKQRTKMLTEIIEIEQATRLFMDLYKKNFYQVYELSIQEVMNIVVFNNEKIKEKTSNMTKEEQFDFYNRVRAYFIRFNQYQSFASSEPLQLALKSNSLSTVQQLFSEELQGIQMENILMVSLLELGNTIDGVTIAAKVLKEIEQLPEDSQKKPLFQNFQTFQMSFKKRKCHCCMEYILDAGRAVTCTNLIRAQNPCLNLYCQSCVVAFMEEKHNFEEDEVENKSSETKKNPDVEKVQPLEEEKETSEKRLQKEKEAKTMKHKLWLKACQNILFICPCCQGYCLTEKFPNPRKEFSQFSVCNFNYKLEHHPRSFLRRDLYWYQVKGINKMFYLAKVVGLNKQKQLHKIEVLQSSQTFQLRLSREEIFFTQTVKKGTKLFDIIDKQGTELDIQSQIAKYIKDFKNFETYVIFDRYINFIEKCDKDKQLIVPKFQYTMAAQTSRGEFLQCHRQLYRVYDQQIFEILPDCKTEYTMYYAQVEQPVLQPTTPVVVKAVEAPPVKQPRLPDSPKPPPEQVKKEPPVQEKPKEVAKPPPVVAQQQQPPAEKKRPPADINNNKMLMKIGKTCVLVDRNDKQQIENLKKLARSNTPVVAPDPQPAQLPADQRPSRKTSKINYKVFNEIGRDTSEFQEDAPRDSQIKFVPPQDISIGQKMILEKNFQLAQEQADGDNQFSLLITKEVFKVEKVDKSTVDPTAVVDTLRFGSIEKGEYEMEEDSAKKQIEFHCPSDCSVPYLQSGPISPKANWVVKQEDQDPQHVEGEVHEKPQQQRGVISKYSIKDYEPKQYNLRRGNLNDASPFESNCKKKLVFQPTVKTHVEEGFFDDWPEDIIKEFKLKVSRKPRKNDSVQQSAPSEVKKDEGSQEQHSSKQIDSAATPKEQTLQPMRFKRKFILTDKLLEDCAQSLQAAVHYPLELEELYIYIYREETKIWRRALVKTCIDADNLVYSVEYQDAKRSNRRVDLKKVKFNIDQEVDQNQKELFNSKIRVKKLLVQANQKQQEQNESNKRQKVEEVATPVLLEDKAAEQQPTNIINNTNITNNINITNYMQIPKEPTSPEKVSPKTENPEAQQEVMPSEEPIKEEEHSRDVEEPKQEWVRDMKLYIICKSKEQQKNHKVLKFYHQHQEIDGDEETLSFDYMQEQKQDEQKFQITKLIEQIKTQNNMLLQQPLAFAPPQNLEQLNQNYILNKLEYENQLIQQEKLDYLKKIELQRLQHIQQTFFPFQQNENLQLRQLKFLQQIQRIQQFQQQQNAAAAVLQQPLVQQPLNLQQPQQEEFLSCYNITQEEDFLEILASFVKYKSFEESNQEGQSDTSKQEAKKKQLEKIQEMIDQIDAMKDLWPSATQMLPEELDMSKIFDSLDQAIQYLDETFKNEKDLEKELIAFMQVYKKYNINQFQPAEEKSSDDEEVSTLKQKVPSNDSTQFPLNIQNEEQKPAPQQEPSISEPQQTNDFLEQLNGKRAQQQPPQPQQDEVVPFQLMQQIGDSQQPYKYPSLIDQIHKLFQIKNSFVRAKRLQYFLFKFYQEQIMNRGYKKCKCAYCSQLEYPILIQYDADHLLFEEQHKWQLKTIQLNGSKQFLNSIFSQAKSKKTLQEERYVAQMPQNLHQPIFDLLVAKEQSGQETQERPQGILPKISSVTKDVDPGKIDKLSLKFEAMKQQYLAKEEPGSYDSDQYERDTQSLQLEFSQLREMQKLLNEMKMQKIEKHKRNKQKYQRRQQKKLMLKNQSFLNQVFNEVFSVPIKEESVKTEVMTVLQNPVISQLPVLDRLDPQ